MMSASALRRAALSIALTLAAFALAGLIGWGIDRMSVAAVAAIGRALAN